MSPRRKWGSLSDTLGITSYCNYCNYHHHVSSCTAIYRGFVCCALPEERLKQLELPEMIPNSTDHIRANYCITADFKEGTIKTQCLEMSDLSIFWTGTTTGISAADRAKTASALADFNITDPNKFVRPGHMVTLQSAKGGVLTRGGHTEASVGKNFYSYTLRTILHIYKCR